MKYVFLSSLIFLFECNSAHDSAPEWTSIQLSETIFKLNEALPQESNFIKSYTLDGREYLYVLDPHNHGILIVDKLSGDVEKIDFFKKCLQHSKLSGFYLRNDTLLLFHRFIINRVHYYDINNQSKGSLFLKKSQPFLENILIDTGTPAYFNGEDWKFINVPDTFPFKSNYLMIDKRFNEKTGQEYKNIIEVPSYKDTIFLHESLPYRISVSDTVDYYSWGFNDSIFAINQDQKIRKIFFGSINSRVFSDSVENELDNYYHDFHYRQLIFDPQKKIFYRIALDLKRKATEQKILIAYDENFEKISEKFLPTEVLIDFYFIDKDGLHFMLNEDAYSNRNIHRFLTVNPSQ